MSNNEYAVYEYDERAHKRQSHIEYEYKNAFIERKENDVSQVNSFNITNKTVARVCIISAARSPAILHVR